MQGPNGTRPAGMPVPSDLDAFVSGWTLETWETAPFDAALRGTAEGRQALPQAAR
jgi:hypothetical protein